MKRILLAVDDKKNFSSIKEILTDRYEICPFDSQATGKEYDLCITDSDFLSKHKEILQQLRRNEESQYLPVLLVINLNEAEFLRNDIKKYIDEVITTPLDKDELLFRVRRILEINSKVIHSGEFFDRSHGLREAIVECMPLAVYGLDDKGVVLSWNRAAEKMFGWRAEEVIGETLPIVPSEKENEFRTLVKRIISGESIVGVELRRRRKDGTIFDCRLSTAPIRDEKNKIIGIMAAMEDITEEKRAEKAILESEQKFRALFHSIRDAILIADNDRNIIDCNKAFTDIFGYSLEEIKGEKTFYVYENMQQFEELGEAIKSHYGDKPFNYTVNYKRKDGSVFPGETGVFYLKDAHNNVTGFIGLIRDVSERIKREKKLKESEERFRNIVEGAPDPIFIQTDKKFSYLNPAACRLFGIKSPEELIGKPVMDRFHPDYHEKVIERIRALNEGRKTVHELLELRFIRVDGSEVWVETAGEPIIYEGKQGALVFVRDISQRKTAEDELRKLKDNLEKQVEEKTKELQERVAELERFHEATVNRELRMKELREEIKRLKWENDRK
ncbi:PAS domain S-box protein [Flexistipes sp.]|uniref:PAS domain S-box protein n=1 Tax=Flexistipes sp. TaxID=3088135 RepID=UPI002E1FE5CF|nr:PAS domain S-box protein [Flexistipes sp.]